MADNKTTLDDILNSLNGNFTDSTMNWMREMYGVTATNKTEAIEQLALLRALGEGKSKGMRMLEGAKAGADLGSDMLSKIAQMLPESHETVAAGPRGFGIVRRK